MFSLGIALYRMAGQSPQPQDYTFWIDLSQCCRVRGFRLFPIDLLEHLLNGFPLAAGTGVGNPSSDVRA